MYANGVIGGPTVRNEIVINFFIERNPLPYETVHELNENGDIGAVIKAAPDDKEDIVMLRKIDTGVIMTLQTAKELHLWLGKQIELIEQREKNDNS